MNPSEFPPPSAPADPLGGQETSQTAAGDLRYRLAWFVEDGYRCADVGYLGIEAAESAAPVLNVARLVRGHSPYTHVLTVDGTRVVDARELEDA